MKKFTLFLAVLMLASCFASCDNANESSVPEQSDAVSTDVSAKESEPEVSIPEPVKKEPEIVPHPMTLTITSAKKFVMTTTLDNGKPMSVCWDVKDWGMWNIGSYKINAVDYTSNATDWEYVFRAAANSTGGWVWSGGNHGNETLVDLKIYDGETDEEFAYTVGNTYNCNILKVVEHSKLHWGDTANTYADVTRTYVIAGKLVTLACDFDFTQDAYFQLSYTAMCPISKALGYTTKYTHTDGTTAEYVSDYYQKNPTAAAFTGYFDKGHAALAVDFYPKTENGSHFHVEIYEQEDMTDNFSNADKTFMWDMSASQNKLYFSRFKDGSYTKVASGTHWDTLASWEIIFDE